MNPFAKVVQWFRGGKPAPVRGTQRQQIRARYDNAQSVDENARSYWMADYLSAKSANSFQVRRQLRNRSRYEVSNNPYLFGVCTNNADDLIGTGPTLKVTTKSDAYNRQVEAAWKEWADEINLTEKLRTLKLARTVDGEGFLILKTVEDLENSVKLYPCDVEADQVTTPAPANLEQLWVDGLELHPVTGRPTAYHVLRHHPGDYYFPDFNPLRVDRIRARHVIHWFPKFRPGQVRGVPVFTPALDLFTELRSFRKAVLAKANVAANLSAVLESEAPADADGTQTSEPFDSVAIDRGVMVTLPHGMKLSQFTAAEPSTTYEQFQERCLGEACRPLSYPLNLALGTSQKFNFSSAKLDHINYREGLKVERKDCETVALDRLFAAWFDEALMIPGLLPAGATLEGTPREWHWPGFPTLDATADTQADIAQINAGTMMWREFWAGRGRDWRDVMRQQSAEQKEIEALGLNFGEPPLRRDNLDEPNDAGGGAKKPSKKSEKVKAAFNESDHPRDESGRFGEGGGGAAEKDGGKEAKKVSERFYEAAPRIAKRQRKNMRALLGKMKNGEHSPEDTLHYADQHAERGAKAVRSSYAKDLKAMQGRVADKYGAETVLSPEWKGIARAYRKSAAEGEEIVHEMADYVRANAAYYARPENRDKEIKYGRDDVGGIDEMHDKLVEHALKAAGGPIGDALDAFKAKHKPKNKKAEAALGAGWNEGDKPEEKEPAHA